MRTTARRRLDKLEQAAVTSAAWRPSSLEDIRTATTEQLKAYIAATAPLEQMARTNYAETGTFTDAELQALATMQ